SFFFSSKRRHTRFSRDWSSDVCSSDLLDHERAEAVVVVTRALAERLALGRSALGLSLRVGAAGEEAELRRMVGVVDDVRHESPRSEERRVGKERRTRRKHSERPK